MKKLIGYLGSYFFYYLGYLSIRIANYICVTLFYSLYIDFMMKSWEIQKWANLEKPWEEIKEDDINTTL